jgi:hypothetical protein
MTFFFFFFFFSFFSFSRSWIGSAQVAASQVRRGV